MKQWVRFTKCELANIREYFDWVTSETLCRPNLSANVSENVFYRTLLNESLCYLCVMPSFNELFVFFVEHEFQRQHLLMGSEKFKKC